MNKPLTLGLVAALAMTGGQANAATCCIFLTQPFDSSVVAYKTSGVPVKVSLISGVAGFRGALRALAWTCLSPSS
jgi:hypothetical protein